jgi:hypothetical protein
LVEELLKTKGLFQDGKIAEGTSLLVLAARSPNKQELLRLLISHSTSFSNEETLEILGVADTQTKRTFLKAYNRTLIKSTRQPIQDLPSRSEREAFVRSLSSEEKLKLFSHILSDEWMGKEGVESSQNKLEGFQSKFFRSYFLEAGETLFSGMMEKEQLLEKLRSFAEIASPGKSVSREVDEQGGALYFLTGWKGVQNLPPFVEKDLFSSDREPEAAI